MYSLENKYFLFLEWMQSNISNSEKTLRTWLWIIWHEGFITQSLACPPGQWQSLIAQALIELRWQVRITVVVKGPGFWCTICLGGTVSASVYSLENSESGFFQKVSGQWFDLALSFIVCFFFSFVSSSFL